MHKKIAKKEKIGGYSLIELLFYISFFAVLSIIVINSMILMARAFQETTIQAELLRSGSIMEQISRQIRQSNSISSITATSLKLSTKDMAGTAKTVEFTLSGTDIRFLENDVFTANFNTPNIVVSGLNFTQITTTAGVAVKVALTVRSINDAANRNLVFYDTLVLRGSY